MGVWRSDDALDDQEGDSGVTAYRVTLVASIMTGIVLLVGLSALLLIQEARRRDLEARVVETVWGRSTARLRVSGILGYLYRLGERVRRGGRLYPESDIQQFQDMISAAGYSPRRVLPLLIGSKLTLMVVLPTIAIVVGSFLSASVFALFAMFTVGMLAGIFGPNLLLSMLRRSHEAALQRGTPDALDLLVLCTEAGMGLESALERVSQEMFRSNRAVAVALSGLLDDLRVLPDRREAFQNFGRRSGVEGLQRLATMLGQALQFGTPLGQALRAVASELRRDRLSRLEEKAVKLPAKLLFPMILFIMPSLFIVLTGSTFLRLLDALGTAMTRLPTVVHH